VKLELLDWLAFHSGGLDGWLVKNLFRQYKFPISGDAQVVFLLLVHDHHFALPLKQAVALDARLFVC
jgi:hypothetical protein